VIRILTHWSIVLVTLAVLIFLRLQDGTLTETARLKSFDYLQSTDEKLTSNDIVIVEIDEKSIEAYGQWPWPRDYLAHTIEYLRTEGAGLIIMPILFAEEDRAGKDDILANTLRHNGVIIAQVGTTQTNKNAVPRGIAKIGDPIPWLFEWPGMLGPIPVLGETAEGVGVINIAPESDGVVRRLPLIVTVNGETYPSIAIETIRVATQAPSYQVKAGPTGVQAVRVPGYPVINTDSYARIWLRWNTKFNSVSLTEATQEHIAGKVVIIGLTAEGIGSTIASPYGTEYAHMPVAVSLQTILNGDNIIRSDLADTYELAYLIIIGLLLIVATRFLHYGIVAGIILILSAGSVYGAVYVYSTKLLLFDFSWPVITIVLVGIHSMFNRFVLEFRQKQQIKKQFGTYLSPAMVAKLQKDPSLLKLGGEHRELSIMFTDVRGFTSISEHYGKDVAGLTSIMNRYMTAMTKDILDNNGTIDKYIGDAQMAFWNAPLDDKSHAINSVSTALNMLDSLDKFNEEIKQEGIPAFGMGIGINTGQVIVGNMGSNQRFDYTCLGDAVNLASRLEAQSKNYGVKLVIGQNTAKEVRFDYDIFELDTIAVKGKTEGIKIFTIGKASQEHKEFLKLYYAGEWNPALVSTKLCKEKHPDMIDYYDLMSQRLKQGTPKDWDGTYRATTK
jgi:adenylate cyclase